MNNESLISFRTSVKHETETVFSIDVDGIVSLTEAQMLNLIDDLSCVKTMMEYELEKRKHK